MYGNLKLAKWLSCDLISIYFIHNFKTCDIYNLKLITVFQGILQTKVIILIGVTFLLMHMIPDHILILKGAKESVCSSSCWKVFNPKSKFFYAIWW